jgi:hypothetical protein
MNGLAVSANGANGTNLFAVTLYGGVFLSTNNGESWTQASNGLTDLGITTLVVSPEKNGAGTANLFAGTGSGVFLSTNNGTNWTLVNAGLKIADVNALVISSDGNGITNLFAGTQKDPGVLLSTNHGSSWTPARIGLTASPVSALALIPDGAGGTNLFAATFETFGGVKPDESGVYRSTDNGWNWIPVKTGLQDANVKVFGFWPATGGPGTNIYAGTVGSGVFLSTNNGASWKAISAGLPQYVNVSAFAFSPVSGSAGVAHIFAGTSAGVFLSTNNGTSWTAVNSGMTNMSVCAVALSGAYLFAGNDYGVWRRPLSEMVTDVEDNHNQLPSTFALAQNYPNPFNPSTTITYELPRSSHVSLCVYNTLGQLINVLVDESKPAGVFSGQFDAATLPSGVYFYRLQAEEFTQTKKLVIVK